MMKKLVAIISVLCLGVSGLAGNALAGDFNHPKDFFDNWVDCPEEGGKASDTFCLAVDDIEVEVKIQCSGATRTHWGGIGISNDNSWGVNVADANVLYGELETQPPYDYICTAWGWHDRMKSEGKCTDRLNDPKKGNANFDPYEELVVKYKIITVDTGCSLFGPE